MDLQQIQELIRKLMSSQVAGLMPFFIIMVLFYAFVIRPQGKKIKEREDQLSKIKVGDKIVTMGGIVGKVVSVTSSEDQSELMITSGNSTEFIILRSSISKILTN